MYALSNNTDQLAEQQHGPLSLHPLTPSMHAAQWAYCGQYQQYIPSGFYPPPEDPWIRLALYGPIWNTSHSPNGSIATKKLEEKRLPPIQPRGSPFPQQSHAMGHRSLSFEQKRQDFEPNSLSSPLPSSARGPPCKPRRTGWALWVGNLPQRTTVVHLKNFFAWGATADIESVFWIKRTNCAFVNYKTEQTCLEAMHRFNNSEFRGNRLVCRVRRGSLSDKGSTASPTPSESNFTGLLKSSNLSLITDAPNETDKNSSLIVREGDGPIKRADSAINSQDSGKDSLVGSEKMHISSEANQRIFILKSLTLQDLLVSTRDGVWMTQSHNEDKLNEAFRSAENVYLIFSVNKSGQFFGYARMESPIDHGSNQKVSMEASSRIAQHSDSGRADDGPCWILTPATATAPSGHIIDDSARGTIFWEAELAEGDAESENSGASGAADGDRANGSLGKEFAVRWLSVTRVPFRATRGLRNPLNGNREVKIARDGTEVEAWTGSSLLHLFHQGSASKLPLWRK